MIITFESATAHKVICVDFNLKAYFIRPSHTLRTTSHTIVYVDTNKDLDSLEKELIKNGFIEERKEEAKARTQATC